MISYFSKLPKLKDSLEKSISILDIGAGNCIAISEMAKLYPNKSFTGTGIQEISKIPENVKFVKATATKLPFENGCFDIVITIHGLSWEIEQHKAIEEIFRVLKPNGKAFLFFTPFDYSIEHKFGEDFWDIMGFSKNQCIIHGIKRKKLSTIMDINIEKKEMKHPYKNYKYLYYIEIDKSLTTAST